MKQARDIFGNKPGDILLLPVDENHGIAIPPKGAFVFCIKCVNIIIAAVLIDFIYGYQFYSDHPLSVWDIQQNRPLLNSYPEEYSGMFSAIAVNEYNPVDPDNDYTVSKPNEYYLKLIYGDHHDQWIMGENI